MKNRLIAVMVLTMSLVATASAVKMSSNGIAEVIIAPYYTVQGGNSTLISITNVSNETKAVKLRFRESQHGLSAGSINIYLPPSDVWTGKIEETGDGAKLVTNDPSCTQPGPESGFLLVNDFYKSDAAGGSLARTREGYIEIFDMGSIIDDDIVNAVSFDHSKGEPKEPNDCGLIDDYWMRGAVADDDGIWRKDPNHGMVNHFGGLMAQVNIINVQDGVEYSEPLTLFTAFSDSKDSLHSAPLALIPDLRSASPSESESPSEIWSKAIDAVSGLIMAESLLNEFTVNASVDASSEWSITFPTKYVYTDTTGEKQPFTKPFGVNGACEEVTLQYWDRDTKTRDTDDLLKLCYAANIVKFTGVGEETNIFHANASASDEIKLEDGYANGWAKMSFVTMVDTPSEPPLEGDYVGHFMKTSGGKKLYPGLPVIGFFASRLGNENVGVGAAYAGVSGHKFVPSEGRTFPDIIDKDFDGTNRFYDALIQPGERHVYAFTPKKQEGRGNLLYDFTVVEHGPVVMLNLGLSDVRGRVEPQSGDTRSCFTGPGPELGLNIGTSNQYTNCLMEYDKEYFFTIQNTNSEKAGGYRFSFESASY